MRQIPGPRFLIGFCSSESTARNEFFISISLSDFSLSSEELCFSLLAEFPLLSTIIRKPVYLSMLKTAISLEKCNADLDNCHGEVNDEIFVIDAEII